LWQKMVPLAQRYGVSRVTQALRVNYGGLQRRLEKGSVL
jgi:hypothetical protein